MAQLKMGAATPGPKPLPPVEGRQSCPGRMDGEALRTGRFCFHAPGNNCVSGNMNFLLLSLFMVYGQFMFISYGKWGEQNGITVKCTLWG